MNRYLSTVGLYARSSLYKILLITLVTALLAGFLVYRYPTPQEITEYHYDFDGNPVPYTYNTPYLDDVIGFSRAPVVCAVGFTAIVAVMCLTGCGYGVKTDYTVRRLRVREKTACLLWAGYHAAMLLFFWAVLALTLYGVLLHSQGKVPEWYGQVGSQTMMMLCYTDTFLHHLMPLQDPTMWGLSISSVLAVSFATVLFSYRQRHGSFSPLVLLALGGTIGSFFCGLMLSAAYLLLMLLLLGVAGAAFCILMGGDDNAV